MDAFVVVIAVCRCGCGPVVTAGVGLLCSWSLCGGAHGQGYLFRELLPSPRVGELLESTWVAIVR